MSKGNKKPKKYFKTTKNELVTNLEKAGAVKATKSYHNFSSQLRIRAKKKRNPITKELLKEIDLTNYSDIINAIIREIKSRDLDRLHRLDELLLEEAVAANNKKLIDLTLIAYSFRKLMSKKHILYSVKWDSFSKKAISDLQTAKKLYENNRIEEYNRTIEKVHIAIQNTDKTLGYFVHNLMDSSRAKLASSAYAYGMSLSQATKLLSAQKERVMGIIGNTKMADEDRRVKSIKERVSYLSKRIN